MLGEEKPTARYDYHAQLVRRVGRNIVGDRPAILEGDLLNAVDEARKFRHFPRGKWNACSSFKSDGATTAYVERAKSSPAASRA